MTNGGLRKGFVKHVVLGVLVAQLLGLVLVVATQSIWGLIAPSLVGMGWFGTWEIRTRRAQEVGEAPLSPPPPPRTA